MSVALWMLAGPAPAAVHSFVTIPVDAPSFRAVEDDEGGFYFAWADPRALILQHLDGEGHALWDAPGRTISSDLSTPDHWSAMADGRSGVTIFWNEKDGMHVQRLRPDGRERWTPHAIVLSTSAALQPDATPDALGGTLVVWSERLTDNRSVVMAERLDEEGKSAWPGDWLRVCLRASHQTNPRVVYDNMSGMIVAWRDEANGASELRAQRVDFQGNRLWSLEGQTLASALGKSDYPIMAPAGTGEAVLAWTRAVHQIEQVILQKVGPEPALKWGPGRYASTGPVSYNRWNPSLAGDGNGGTWVAWEDFRNQVNYQIQLNHLNGKGLSTWPGGEIAVAPTSGDQGRITVMSNGKDGAWLAWIDNRQATVGLYVQEVDESGNRLRGKSGTLVADELAKPGRPQLTLLGAGKVLVSWSDRTKKGHSVVSWSIVGKP